MAKISIGFYFGVFGGLLLFAALIFSIFTSLRDLAIVLLVVGLILVSLAGIILVTTSLRAIEEAGRSNVPLYIPLSQGEKRNPVL